MIDPTWTMTTSTYEAVLPPYRAVVEVQPERESYYVWDQLQGGGQHIARKRRTAEWRIETLNVGIDQGIAGAAFQGRITAHNSGDIHSGSAVVAGYAPDFESAKRVALNVLAAAVFAYETTRAAATTR